MAKTDRDQEIPEPEDGVVHPKMLKKCQMCMHLRIRLFHPHPPTTDDTISWFTAEQNVEEIFCRKGRIRFRDGREKTYRSKHGVRLNPDIDRDCPDFDPDD